MSGTINRTATIPGVSSNSITIVTAQPGGNVTTTQTIKLIPTQPGSSRNFPPIKTITVVKGQPGGSSVHLPPPATEPEFTAELLPSSSLPVTETVTSVTAESGQGHAGAWNFESLEEKNPLSELSEEHLNKLDEVLASADVQEILQQSVGSLEGAGDQSGSEPVELQECDLSVLSAAFTDHAYAVHPDKAPKSRPVMVTTTSKPKPIVVTVGPNEVYEKPAVNVSSIPSVVPQSLEPPSSVTELYPSSPSSVDSSPRKSGRSSKARKFDDEDWVTSSPRRGRGRGLIGLGTDSPPGYGNKRQSSRIEDQKQRELAEKILQANRQALEAEKLTGSSAESFLGGFDPVGVRVRAPGLGSQPVESEGETGESDVDLSPPKGRGRGRGRGRGKKSSDDEKKVGKQTHDNLFDRLNDNSTYSGLNESTASSQLDTTIESDTEKTTDDVKTTEVSDVESDNDDDNDSVGDKKETVKKKPGKKRSMWDTKRRKKKKKAPKVREKVTETETEATMDSDSDKSDVDDDDDDVKDNSKTKKVGKKGKKVGKVKEKKIIGKKDKGKDKKSNVKAEDSDVSDMETDVKSKEKKTLKKLSKKERLKKLKEAKKAKKAKLLEKKKAKLKEKKLKKGKAGKGKESAAESDKSPKKKKKGKKIESDKKKGVKDLDMESASDSEEDVSTKKSKKGQASSAASPVKKKKGKASDDKEETKGQGQAKKKKLKASEETEESEGQGSPKKKKAKLAKDKVESPVKGKKGKAVGKGKDTTVGASPKKLGKQAGENKEELKKSPTKAGKRKELEETSTVPTKKQKIEVDKKAPEGIRSDSDDDVPLQKIKSDIQEENTPLNQIQKDLQAETKASIEVKETSDTLTPKTETVTKIDDQTIQEQTKSSLNTEIENKDSDSVMEPVTNDQSNEEIDILTVETDNNMLQESLVDQKDKVTGTETMSQVVNITNDKTVGGDKSVDKNEGKRRHSDDRDTSESRSKKRDSRDSSKDHRKHSSHHHRHSRDSRESSHDRKDTHKDRKDTGGDSKERRKSGSSDKDRHRTDSHDRKGSVSKEGKDSKKALKKDERQSSVGVPNSEKKKLKTPGKVDKKKVRKSIDDRVDSLWTDLFTPDVTPSQKGKLKKESSIDKSGAATKKTASDDKSRTVSEKDDSVSSIDSALNKPENKDTVRESSIDRSDTSIFDKFKDLDKMVDKVRSDKSKAKDIEADKGGEKLKVETNENEKVETPANNESKSEEISEIKSEMKDAVTNAVDDLNSASQKTEIKDEKPISASQDAKTDQDTKTDQKPVKDEKFVKTEQKMVKDEKSEPKIKDEKNIKSEPKIIKGDKRIKTEHKTKREERDKHDSKKKDNKDTVQKEIKKEKESYDKEKLQKKLKDKAKRMKEKLLESNEKDKKGYKKEKMSSKQDRSRSLSSDKGRKLSPDKSVQVIRVSSLEELEKHRKLSEETAKKKHMSGETSKPEHGSGEGKSRPTRNKAVAFAEILKKEKLGSDDNDEGSEDDSEYNDDEADETWEDPGKLYCLCRQPHNKRFMICCDKCEEWFHGKCVGITRARGEEMEKNDEEYICPQCSEKEEEPVDTKAVVTSTESPDQSHKKSESKETSSLSDSMEVTSTHEGVEKSDSLELPRPDSTVQSPIKRDSQDSHTSPRPHPGGSHTPQTPTRVRRDSGSPRKLKSPDSEGGKGYIRKRSPKDVSPAEKKKRIKSFKPEKPTIMFSQRKCLCGCNRLARVDSLFWGKECELRNEELRREEAQAEAARKAAEAEKKLPQEKRVAVVEKGTGKTLTGHKAPRESELQDWLQRHPTFEVLKSHRRLSSKDSSRDRASDSSEVSDREKSADDSRPEKPLPRGPEPVRLNVRKGLRDALAARADAADDIVLSNSEIKGLALTIEEEMFKCFKDTDHKYKAKYRSLVFNIKDHKNKGLFRKILNRRIRPYQLVRMTPEELASQELSKWREHETKHQLEMIEQTEEALLHEHPHIMKKTHKGEEEVEAEGEEDLSSLAATEPKKEELSVKIDPKADVLSSILPDTTDQHGKHLFDSNCSVCTGKIVPHPESSETSKTTVVHEEPQPQEVEPEPTQKEKDRQAQEVVKEVLKAIKLAQAEADREKAEAQKQASSVTVRSPDSALSSGLEKKAKFEPQGPQLWKGFVYMQDVSKFVTSAYRVTGPADHLDLPDTIHVCGRINPEHVWDYLAKVKQAASRDICVIRFIPGNNEEKAAYINLYSYLNSRSRCGVVQNSAKHIKDFYIVPLPSHSRIPSVLKPFDGPGLEENRCHMLIGVIIRNKTRPGSHSHTHKHDPRKLKSNLKDPAPEKPASSSSSSPTSSTSSATPQDKKKKKKAKSISFDPIVKEYSHVASDQEETPDVSYDPSAPYDPEKEAEATKPKQETKDDPVSKMIEKIALSKNPVEATATMVAALATSSRLGNQNQRKLLLELTKKVDEQKKALEKKRLLAASGKSPSSVASPSEKSGTTDNIGSTSTSSPHSNKSHMNRNDPRLMPKKTVESAEVKDSSVTEISTDSVSSLVAAAPSVAAGPTVYSPLKDLQASRAAQTAAQQQQTMAKSDLEESKTDNKDNDVTSPAVKPFSFTVKSKSHPVSKSVIEDDYDEDKIKLHKLDEDEDETVFKPKGFYVDHEEKVSPDQEQAGSLGVSSESNIHQSQEDIVVEEVVASETVETNDTETLSGSDKDVQNVNNGSEETKSSEESMEDKLNATDKTVNASKGEKVQSIDFDIISHLQAEVSGSAKSDTVIPKSLQMVGLLKDKEAKEKEAKDKESKEGQALDILSQLHASVWGSKSNKEQGKETGQGGDKSEPGTKSSQLQTDSGQSPVKLPQNILNILKEVTDKPGAKAQPKASESQQQQAGQLPKSLLSLFSGIPSGSKSASDSKTVSTADVDLRPQAKKSGLDTTVKKPVNPTLEAKPEVKVTKEKLSKSLAAFDYDSDSDSEGSFEGFDDDGLKSLSPRKRKLVAKQSPARADSDRETTNEFGDVDIRVPPKQGGLSKPTVEEPFGFPAEDVDLRQRRGPSDVDHRMPVGRDERNQTGAEFLPPGEELQVSEFPADVDERIQKPAPTGVVFSTPGVVFTTPDAVPIRPPPLHDVDHRQMPFPPPGAIPPGMRPLLPFMGSNQPPPPGEDWVPGQPAPPPLPLIPAGEPPPLPEEVPKEILPPLPVKPPKDEIDRNEPDKTKVEERATDDMKDKADDGRTGKDKKGKKKKKKEKKKGELMASDEILKARVLEIARNEPIEPPPLPPILGPSVPVPVPGYSGAPPPMAVSGSIAGSVPISGPPAARMAMQGPQGPVLSQPQTLNSGPISQTQTSYPVSSQNMSYPQGPGNRPFQTSEGPRGKQWQGSSEGQQMPPKQWQGPQDKPQMPPQAKKWQGPPARASPGPTPPSLFDIEVKPTKKLVVPPDGRSPSSSNVQPKLPPSKQDGLLPMPDLPQNVPRADQGLGLGPGQFNRQPGPSTVSSLGPNPFSHHDEPGGTHGSTEGHDAIPPHGSQEFGDDRGSWDRCHRDRHRDRQDRHSGSRERDSDRHRQDHHRDDRDYHDDRDYRSNRAISDRHSSERYSRDTDRHDRSDRHSSERQGRDYDRHREDYRSDHRSGDRHDDHHRRDDRGDHHRRRGRDDYNRHDRRSRH